MNDLRFMDSITDFFRSPKWLTNLLLGGVCILIPAVGPLVLMGWLATIFHGRVAGEHGETDYWRLAPAQWPAFDFAKFVIYLQRGVWPFLVALVACVAMLPVLALCFLPVLLVLVAAGDGHPNDAAMMVATVLSVGLWLVMALLLNLLLAPFSLRAYVLQDFTAALSFRWARDFLSRMWKDLLLVVLFGLAAGLVFALGGYVLLCVGIYFTMGLAIFSAAHLQRQLLDLYVQRGGEPLVSAPVLLDQPPQPLEPWPPPPPPPAS